MIKHRSVKDFVLYVSLVCSLDYTRKKGHDERDPAQSDR